MTVLAGRYELGDELGAGGMATVVAAHDRVLDRPVAVKLLPPGSDPRALERFLREARTAARLRHPGVVAVHDTGEDEGRAFIVMELVSGQSLADLLEERGRLAVEEAVAITVGVLEALAEAHALGMVHRDVKPANVLLPEGGGVKLADFGLAKAFDGTDGGLTTTGAVVGTPTYLAPELLDGVAPSPASDVYSVGCLLFALLAGRPPFTADSALAVAYAHRHEPVPAIATVRSDIPGDVRTVMTRALEKDPADRYPHAAAMRASLLARPETSPVDETDREPAPASPPAVAEPAPTEELRGSAAPSAPRRARWVALGLVGVVVPLAILAWALGARTGPDETDAVGGSPPAEAGSPPAEPPEDAGGAAEDTRGAPEDDGAPEDAGAPEDDGAPPEDAGAPEDDGAPQDAGAPPEEAGSLTEMIAGLADAPPGSYGEKHDDLLDDLLEISREQDPRERAEEAADLRAEVDEWVGAGELDAELGARASALLAEEAAGR